MIDRNEMDNRAYIPAFDGVRAVAILAIIAHQLFAYRIQGGFLGVNMFLILSGYFMTNSLMTSLMDRGKVSLRTFLARRLSRVMQPLLAMLVTVVIYVMLFQRELLVNLRGSLVSSFFFVNNWWQIFQDSGHTATVLTQSPFAHLWYVSIAFQYYLLWPILFVFLSVLCRKHRQLLRVVGILTVASAVVMLVTYQLTPSTIRVLYGTDTRAFSIFIGGMVALIYPLENLVQPSRVRARYEQVIRLVPVIVMVLMLVMMKESSARTYRGGMLLFDIVVAAVIVLSLHQQSVTSIFFRLKPLTWIGRRSMVYYLWYLPVFVLYQARVGDTSMNVAVHLFVSLVIIVIIGEIWFQLFEKNGSKTFLQKLSAQFPIRYQSMVSPVFISVLLILSVIGFFQATPRLSAQESALQQTMLDNETLAQNTQTMDKQVLRTINNIQDLSREETVFSSMSSVTFIGDSSLLAMAQELPTIYPNATISTVSNLQVYEMMPLIQQLTVKQQIGDIVVLMVGTNGAFSKGQLEAILKAIGMDKQIFLMTSTVNRTWQNHVNQVFQQLANQYSNVHLLDWKTQSQGHTDWFYEGGSFVNTSGAHEQALWLAKTIYQALRGS